MVPARPGYPAAAAVAWALVGRVTLVEGGLRTKPPGGLGARGPRRLQSPLAGGRLAGLEYVASGYDVFFGNPDPTSGAVDDGFRRQVFKLEHGSGTLQDGSTSIPDGISTLSCNGSCSFVSTTTAIETMAKYYAFLSTSAYLEAGFPKVASFSASLDFLRVRQGLKDHKSVYTTVVAHCCAYKAFVETYTPPPAHEDFLAAVDRAPVNYDQDSYFDIICEFGTHFLSSATLGAMYGEETKFTQEQYNNMKAANNDWWIWAQASFIVSIKAGVSSKKDLISKEFFNNYSMTTRKYSMGAMPPQDGDVNKWLAQTISQPVPTNMKLKPLSELFTMSLVPGEQNLTKLDAKRKNMERALQEYCPEKLLKEGKVDSCKMIESDPDAPATDDKTCLAKVWGGGGPNGQPLDDSREMVELHGLSENLQVSKIKFQSERWLDNIELVLSQGSNRWPLKEHGGKGGVHDTLTFSDGQKIIAVNLEYDRYINRITFWTNDGYDNPVGDAAGAHSKMVDFEDAIWNATGRRPRDAWLVGLYGHSQKYVDSLGFYVAYTCSSSEVPGPAGVPASAPSQTASGRNATNAASSTDLAITANAANATNSTSTTNAAVAARPPA